MFLRGLFLVWGLVLVESAGTQPSKLGPPLTISVANYQMAPTDPEGEMLKVLGAQFGVKLSVFNFDNQRFHEQLNLKLAAGVVPDFLYLRTATTLGNYVQKGLVAPIPDEVLRLRAPRLVRVLETYAPGYLAMGRIGGIQYGIPVVSPTNRFHVPLVYRADWMQRVGVNRLPETLAEFETLMGLFSQDPDGDGVRNTYGLSKDGLDAVFGAFGQVPFDEKTDYWLKEDGVVINSALSRYSRQALGLLAAWYRKGWIDPEFITGENKGGYWALSHAFLEGRIGFTTHGNYYHWATKDSYSGAVPVANGKELSRALPEARLALGRPLWGPGGRRGIKAFNGLMNFVTIGKPAAQVPGKVEKILEILDASASDDPVERLSLRYGVEGKHWKLVDPSTEEFTILPPYDRDEAYWSRIGAVLAMETPRPLRAPRERWAESLGLDRDGIVSLVQVGLPTMSRYEEPLRKRRLEAYIAIITGTRPLEHFDEFKAEYLAAGGSLVQAEVNRFLSGRP